jgi:hypothetical protein
MCLDFPHVLTCGRSSSTIKRRRKALGLKGSGSTRKEMTFGHIEQLVLDHVGEDLAKHHGVRTIQSKIAQEHMVHVPRSIYAIPGLAII